MKNVILVVLTFLAITSCSTTVLKEENLAPTPPNYASYCNAEGEHCDVDKYADDLNWYMIFIFSYTKAFNEYAKTRGWEAPHTAPICRLVEWPKLEPFPNFDPNSYDKNINDFEWKLTQYVKKLKKIYSAQRDDVHDREYIQRELCTY